jgi:hypothetical protein
MIDRTISPSESPVRARSAWIGRIACMIVLGTLLAGCDKCGDWWWTSGQGESCHRDAPRPQ